MERMIAWQLAVRAMTQAGWFAKNAGAKLVMLAIEQARYNAPHVTNAHTWQVVAGVVVLAIVLELSPSYLLEASFLAYSLP